MRLFASDVGFYGRRAEPVTAEVVPKGDRPSLPGADQAGLESVLGLPEGSLDGERALVSGLIEGAITRCEEWAGIVPAEREVAFRYDLSSYISGHPMVAPLEDIYPWVNLPRRPVTSVDSVEAEGEPVPDYREDLSSNPPRVRAPFVWAVDNGMGSLEITVTAGDPVPDDEESMTSMQRAFVAAAIATAAYLYDNVGCTPAAAISSSGAREILKPYKLVSGAML